MSIAGIFLDGSCRRCEEICPEKAIDFDQKEERIEEKVGAIVVATGYDLYPKEELGEYGYGEIPDVIDGLTFERMLSPEWSDERKNPSALRWEGAEGDGLYPVCGLERSGSIYALLLPGLLHVHGQACNDL